jgi:hypothetical protein
VTKSGGRNAVGNTTTRIESAYPGSTYVVLTDYNGLLDPGVQHQVDLLDRNTPQLYFLGEVWEETRAAAGHPYSRTQMRCSTSDLLIS